MLYHTKGKNHPRYIGLVYCPPENREIDPSRVIGSDRHVPDIEASIPWNIVTSDPFKYHYYKDDAKIFEGDPFDTLSLWEGGDDQELYNWNRDEHGKFYQDDVLKTFSEEGIPLYVYPNKI